MKTKEQINKMMQEDFKKKDLVIKERWENLKKFEKPEDVPHLPIPLTPFYIEKLIEAGAIPKKDLIEGKLYLGECRNADKAIWNKTKNCFVYRRNKFGYIFDEDINHFEDDNGFDLFVPIKEL
jgi:hypothetical protein